MKMNKKFNLVKFFKNNSYSLDPHQFLQYNCGEISVSTIKIKEVNFIPFFKSFTYSERKGGVIDGGCKKLISCYEQKI
jgi:hypothetical protein